MEIDKVALPLILSKRALDIIKNPDHLESNEEKELWSWNLILENDGSPFLKAKFLTISYSNISLNQFDSLFLETLSRLSMGKNLEFINRLTFREIESYLRDRNHTPAFLEEAENLLEQSFKRVKNSLFGAAILKKIKINKEINSQFISWNELTFVEKNRKVIEVLSELTKLFSLGKGPQLALAERETISVIKNDFPMDLEVIEFVLQSIFGGGAMISSLKVVAAL